MEGKKYTLKQLLLATVCFAMVAFVIAQEYQFYRYAIGAHERGQGVCGLGNAAPMLCMLLLACAGIATLKGYRYIAAITGLLSAVLIGLATFGRVL